MNQLVPFTAHGFPASPPRVGAAGIKTRIENHTFRATGITAYLKMVGRWSRQRQWRTTPQHAPLSFTTAAAMS
jgi:hypothetical protein